MFNIPIKNTIQYLGISIIKDPIERQELHFSPKLKKAKNIFNNWLIIIKLNMVLIPYNIFKKFGGLHFLLMCDYSVNKLRVALSNFYQQALKAWKLCYVMYTAFLHVKLFYGITLVTINRKSEN